MCTLMSAHYCWHDIAGTCLNNKCPIVFLPLSYKHLAHHGEDIGSQAQRALIKHQKTRWGQIWGQVVDLKVTNLNVLLACSVFAWPWVCKWDTHTQTPPQRWNRNVCNSHVSQLRGGMFVCICENLTYEHTHRHAAMWNATSTDWLAGLAVVSGCSRCSRLWPWHICVCFKSQPLPLGRWQSSSAWGDETWDRQSLVVNNNSFMRQRRLPAAFKDLSERQRLF